MTINTVMQPTRIIKIEADMSSAQRSLRTLHTQIQSIGAGGFSGLQTGIVQTGTAAQQLAAHLRALAANSNSASSAAANLGANGSRLTAIFRGFGGVIATLGLAGAAAGFMHLSDKSSEMVAKLTLATRAVGDYATAQADVARIANSTRSDINSVADLYSTMARNADTLGLSQAQVAAATTTTAMALKVGGTEANAAASALLQLSQALGAGKLAGDEFASINEAAPRLMEVFAQSMNVPRGALKALAAEGKITAAEITKALTNTAVIARMKEEFASIPVAFADVGTSAMNTAKIMAGAFSQGFGISKTLGDIVVDIQAWAAEMAPKFTEIGKTFRKAFDTIGPLIGAVMSTAGAAIRFVVDNMDALVGVAIAATAGFLAFKAATAAQGLAGGVGQVIALQRALGATGPVSALAAAGLKLVQGSVNGLTTAIAANPIGAIAVALTATIALLYHFRDAINIGGGNLASLGDLGRASFEMIGESLSKFGAWASEVFSDVGSFFTENFGWIGEMASSVFSDIDFSLAGFLQMSARVVDAVVGHFRGGFRALVTYWTGLPKALGTIFANAFNSALGFVENFINRTISGINRVLSFANSLGAAFAPLENVKLGRMDGGGAVTLGADMGKAYMSGFGTEVRDGVKSLINRANEIGLNRIAPKLKGDAAAKTNAAVAAPAGDKDKDKDKAAKTLEDRLKKEREFWATLQEQAKAAAMTTRESELYNKQLELRRILGDGELSKARELTSAENTRLDILLRQKEVGGTIKSINESIEAASKTRLELEGRADVLRNASADSAADELTIWSKMVPLRQQLTQAIGTGLEAELTKRLSIPEAAERENLALERKNKLIEAGKAYGAEALKTHGSVDQRQAAALKTRNEVVDQLRAAYNETTPEFVAGMKRASNEYSISMKAIAGEFYDDMTSAIDGLANQIGGKVGDALGALGGVVDSLKALDKNGSLAKGLQSVFGKDSKLLKGLGEAAGKLGAGAEMGGQIAGLAKAIGISKFSTTGSKVGGALGSFVGGPIGSMIGSIAGGVIGGLFKKTKSGSATIGANASGVLDITATGGNSSKMKEAANTAATSVMAGVNQLAERLGASVNASAAGGVTIGQRHGDWRVQTSGTSLKTKNGAVEFDDDAAGAVTYAIQQMVKNGVLTGFKSAFSARALKGATDVDTAVSIVEKVEGIMGEIAAMENPIKAAVDGINTPLNNLIKQMQEMGATSTELADIEKYRSLKLKEALESQIDSLKSFRDVLNGDGSGVTSLNRLNSKMAEFDKYRSDIAAGTTVDQDKFTKLGQEIFQLSSGIYGSSTAQYQSIRGMLLEATDGLIDNVTTLYDDASVVAIQEQTNAITTNQAIQNARLESIDESLKAIAASGVSNAWQAVLTRSAAY